MKAGIGETSTTAARIQLTPNRKTIMPTDENVGPGSQGTPRSENLTWSARWNELILIPATTALVSISVMPTEMVGITPAIAVVTNRPMVIRWLASHTRRRTWGSA